MEDKTILTIKVDGTNRVAVESATIMGNELLEAAANAVAALANTIEATWTVAENPVAGRTARNMMMLRAIKLIESGTVTESQDIRVSVPESDSTEGKGE